MELVSGSAGLSRRRFVQGVGAVGLGVLAGCGVLAGGGQLPWQAQAPPRVSRIGYLNPFTAPGETFVPFREELQALGYVEGLNLVMEVRIADGQADRLPALAGELVALKVDVIAAGGNPATLAAREATSSIPIVQVGGLTNLIAHGVVDTITRPGGNVTGVAETGPELNGKRLELLKQAAPDLSRVAILLDEFGQIFPDDADAAQSLGLQIQTIRLRAQGGVDEAFAIAARDGVNGLVVQPGGATFVNARSIAEQAIQFRLPTIANRRTFVAAGGLMTYAGNVSEISRLAANYVDRILKGANPADLPIYQPMTFDFVINLRTAQALGLTIPQHVLLQATEVIQ